MKRLIFILSFFLVNNLLAQKNYFQQKVNYKINTSLNIEDNSLSSFESIVYVNNSPDTLNYILFHLWPNAYSTSRSPLAKQLAERGNEKLYFEQRKLGGYIDSLDFEVNGKKIKWEYTCKSKEIAKLYLDKPLLPGDSIVITTPFYVKIPASISRMGHKDGRFQISQWYPKPAVYDRYGWHAFPYLDFGEFYSEFGSFDVYITVPKDYVVAATGILQNKEERQWLEDLSTNSLRGMEYENPAKGAIKTLHYHQDSIHDFAWFTARDYYVSKSSVTLPHSKRKVETWAFYTEDNLLSWMTAVRYVDSAVYYYSKWVGDYPYNVCTAVEGALKAGGGMEYPTITVIAPGIGDGLEEVIAHEVGHNWFYGVLGFNEREYPFLDEGINTYYEARYTEQRGLNSMFDFIKHSKHLTYQTMVYLNMEQPLNLHSQKYNSATYQTDVYMQTSYVFNYLAKYLGTNNFDKIMHGFFEKWKFKHPYPDDLEEYFRSHTTKNLDWFFDDIIKTNKIPDYKVKIAKNKVIVKNKGQFSMPVPLQINNDDIIWLDSAQKKQTIDTQATRAVIDPEFITTDYNSYNNFYEKGRLFPRKKSILPHLFFTLQPYEKSTVSFIPIMATNNDLDKTLYGAIIHSYTLPLRNFNYVLVPFYSTATKRLEGTLWSNYKIPAANGDPGISISIFADRYAWDINNNLVENNLRNFWTTLKIEPKKKDGSDKFSKSIELKYQRIFSPANIDSYFSYPKLYSVYQAKFTLKRFMSQLHPMHFETVLRLTDLGNYNFLSQYWTSFSYKLHYVSLSSGLTIRLFAGKNVYINGLIPQNDIGLDIKTLNRFADYEQNNSNVWSHQFLYTQGGFTYFYPNSLMRDGMASINISSTLPLKKLTWIEGYANLGYGSFTGNNWQQFYEYGIKIKISIFDIYLPLGGTFKEYNDNITPQWYNHYRFSIDYNFDLGKLLKM